MPNEENLKPFKKGQSGNPNGRPKGSRNRATVVRQWLEVPEEFKNPITGELEIVEQSDIMVLALIKKAREGDVAAFKELMDSGYGKLLDSVANYDAGELTKEERDQRLQEIEEQIEAVRREKGD